MATVPRKYPWWMSSDEDDGLDWSANVPAIEDTQAPSSAQVPDAPFVSAGSSGDPHPPHNVPVDIGSEDSPDPIVTTVNGVDEAPFIPYYPVTVTGVGLEGEDPHNLLAHIGNDHQQLFPVVESASQDAHFHFPENLFPPSPVDDEHEPHNFPVAIGSEDPDPIVTTVDGVVDVPFIPYYPDWFL